MKLSTKLLSAAVLIASSSIAIAATDTTNIDINVTKDAYVKLLGDFAGNNTIVNAEITEAQMLTNTTFSLGDLGFESNTTGECTISFASTNNWSLVHETNGALNLGNYELTYVGASATVSNTDTNDGNIYTTTGGCNEAPAPLNFLNDALPAVVIAGKYSDTVQVVVTTQ